MAGFRLGPVAAALMGTTAVGCVLDEEEPRSTFDAGADATYLKDAATPEVATSPDAGDPYAAASPAAPISTVNFARDVESTVYAGSNVIALFADKGLAPVDLTDPANPTFGPEETTDTKVIALEYDEGRNIAYAVDGGGKIYVYSLRTAAGFRKIADIAVFQLQNKVTGLARLGGSLFGLAGDTVVPITVSFNGDLPNALMVGTPFALSGAGSRILGAGDVLYIALASGDLQAWTMVNGVATKTGSFALGGEPRSLLAKGSKAIVGVKGVGLAVIDFGNPAAPKRIALDATMKDIFAARLFGRTLVTALERNIVSTVDISDFTAPRIVSANPGTLPKFISVTNGTLLFGNGKAATVANVPPTITAHIPKVSVRDFPLHGQVPVTFSKPIDPSTATSDHVQLTCNGAMVLGSIVLSADRTSLTFLPQSSLAADVDCTLDTSKVKDGIGAAVFAGSGAQSDAGTTDASVGTPAAGAVGAGATGSGPRITFRTSKAAATPVTVPGSQFAHVPDGKFTDFNADGGTATGEWSDVKPAKGMYTYFYADFKDNKLNLMNDWFYNPDKIDPDCYNEFYAWTGNGKEQWTIRAYGAGTVSVLKNGVALEKANTEVQGGASYGPSPMVADPHTMYELQIAASPGTWGVKLHDPGPSFHCSRHTADPTQIQGDLGTAGSQGATVDTTRRPTAPTAATLAVPTDGANTGSVTPTLAWSRGEGSSSQTTYQIQISKSADFKFFVWNVSWGSPSYVIPEGVLAPNTAYFWRVIATNPAGQVVSATRTFSTAQQVRYALTATKTGNGTITGNATTGDTGGQVISCGTSCSANFNSGSVVALTARADTGYVFNGWSGACSGNESTTTVAMNADKTCTAEFVPATTTYPVTITMTGAGTGTITSSPQGIACTTGGATACSASFTANTNIQLTPSAGERSRFGGWSGDCEGNPDIPIVTLTINGTKTCSARFDLIDQGDAGPDAAPDAMPDGPPRYPVAIGVLSGTGTVTSTPSAIECTNTGGTCSAPFNAQTSVTLLATPGDGQRFKSWGPDGDCVGTSNPFVLESINGSKSCWASFEPIPTDGGADSGVVGQTIYSGVIGRARSIASNGSAVFLGIAADAQSVNHTGGIIRTQVGSGGNMSVLPNTAGTISDMVATTSYLVYVRNEAISRFDLSAIDGGGAAATFASLTSNANLATDGQNAFWYSADNIYMQSLGEDFTAARIVQAGTSVTSLAAYQGIAYWSNKGGIYKAANPDAGAPALLLSRNGIVSLKMPPLGGANMLFLAAAASDSSSMYDITYGSSPDWMPLDTRSNLSQIFVDDTLGVAYTDGSTIWLNRSLTQVARQALVTDARNIGKFAVVAIPVGAGQNIGAALWIRAGDGTVALQTFMLCPTTTPDHTSSCQGFEGLSCTYVSSTCTCGTGGWACVQ